MPVGRFALARPCLERLPISATTTVLLFGRQKALYAFHNHCYREF